MDWPYTDCPTLCTRRALTAEDLQSSAPGLVVEADGNGTDFSVSRGGDGDDRDGNILEIGVHTYSLDESLDFSSSMSGTSQGATTSGSATGSTARRTRMVTGLTGTWLSRSWRRWRADVTV